MCVVLESVLLSFFYTKCPLFPAPLIEEAVFLPRCIIASFVKDKVPKGAWVYLWSFRLVLLVYVSFFVCQYHTVLMTVVLWYTLKSGRLNPSALVFFFYFSVFSFFLSQDCFGYLMCLHTDCNLFCSSSGKHPIGNLIEIALGL